jgi:hypothetical protein
MTDTTAKSYDMVTAASPEDLGIKVRAKLQDGWSPFGSPFFVPTIFCQAVVLGDGHLAQINTTLSKLALRMDSLEGTIARK